MPSVDWNKEAWGSAHEWDEDGDEWSGMAAYCGQPYREWKSALIETFLEPHVTPTTDVLEVAPGHGRWTAAMAGRVRELTLVDLSDTCIEACQRRFTKFDNIKYVVNDGRSLPGVPDESVDFVWSFDSFVHIEVDVISAYLGEFARVLRPGGSVLLHHAGKRPVSLRLTPILRRGGTPGRVLQRLIGQGRLRDSGNRSDVSRELVARQAEAAGLRVVSQTDRWGSDGQYTVGKYRDCISVLTRPSAPAR